MGDYMSRRRLFQDSEEEKDSYMEEVVRNELSYVALSKIEAEDLEAENERPMEEPRRLGYYLKKLFIFLENPNATKEDVSDLCMVLRISLPRFKRLILKADKGIKDRVIGLIDGLESDGLVYDIEALQNKGGDVSRRDLLNLCKASGVSPIDIQKAVRFKVNILPLTMKAIRELSVDYFNEYILVIEKSRATISKVDVLTICDRKGIKAAELRSLLVGAKSDLRAETLKTIDTVGVDYMADMVMFCGRVSDDYESEKLNLLRLCNEAGISPCDLRLVLSADYPILDSTRLVINGLISRHLCDQLNRIEGAKGGHMSREDVFEMCEEQNINPFEVKALLDGSFRVSDTILKMIDDISTDILNKGRIAIKKEIERKAKKDKVK